LYLLPKEFSVKTNIKNEFLIILILVVANCSGKPTTPNESIIYQVKKINIKPPLTEKQNVKAVQIPNETQRYLINLYNLDSELALEIGRLPEYQNDISPDAEKALKKFVNLVKHATDEEISNFKNVINEGIPEVRKYCAPLQAVIWLLEKDEIFYNPELFNWSLDKILLESWNLSDSHWNSYNEVTDRLNSSLLLTYYVRSNLSYLSKIDDPSTAQGSYSIFVSRKGNCQGFAGFQCHCLNKAGYDAQIIKVVSIGYGPFHTVCEFKDKDGILYIIDNASMLCPGSGSFDDGNGIIEKDIYTQCLPQIGVGKN
jgi:hypothetical protein